MDTKRTRSVADTTRPARAKKPTAAPEVRLVKYSFNLDEIKSILIMVGATGVVINPPRPRPNSIEFTIEQPAD